jgi:hypothetical protein
VRVTAGEHVVEVVEPGHRPARHTLHVASGRRYRLEVDLEPTTQRIAAWSVLSAGGVGVTLGIVFGALASADLQAFRTSASESAAEDVSPAFEDFTLAAGLAGGVSGALLAIGGALFVLEPHPHPTETAVRLRARGLAVTF